MFCIYKYPANLAADVHLANIEYLLTGGTDKTQLNFAGDAASTAETSIVSEVAAGWTKHSTTYSDTTNVSRASAVFRAPWHLSNVTTRDLAVIARSQYKFVDIKIDSAGGLSLLAGADYSQDNPTYSGDFQFASNTKQRLDKTNGGILFIYATAQCLGMLSYSAANGYGNTNGCPAFVFERKRGLGYDTQAANFPPLVMPHDVGTTFMTTPYFGGGKYASGTSTGFSTGGRLWVVGAPNAFPDVAINADGTPFHQLHAFGWSDMFGGNGIPGGEISSICDVWIFSKDAGATQATAVVAGKTYMIWAFATNGLDPGIRLAVRMG